jgi:cytochrome c biogenesis protein
MNITGAHKTNRSVSFLSSLLSLFESISFSLWLFALLIVASLLGALIPQNEPGFFYAMNYGPATAELLKILSLDNVFEAPWFILILCLLIASTLACVTRRCRILSASFQSGKHPVEAIRWDDSFIIESEKVEQEDFVTLLKNLHYSSVQTQPLSPDEFLVIGRKNLANRLGTLLAHISIVIILFGGVMGKPLFPWAFGYMVSVKELEKVPLPHTDYSLELKKYEEDYYPGTRQPSEFRSYVTLWRGGTKIKEGIIRVNHPLKIGMLGLYQNSRNLAEGPLIVAFAARDTASQKNLGIVRGQPGQPVSLPGTNTQALIWQNQPEKGEPLYTIKTLDTTGSLNQYEFKYLSAKTPWVSTFQVVQDPGIPLVYGGFLLLVAGLFFALFTEYRMLTIRVKQEKEATLLLLSGESCRKKTDWQDEFTKIKRAIKELVHSKGTIHE